MWITEVWVAHGVVIAISSPGSLDKNSRLRVL
jgi:hypothetical protein